MTLPTVSLSDANQLASSGNLASLKQAAATNSPQALREAAKQFESLFTSMVLKSMQQANFKDPLFGSDQGDLYQEMYDDQLASVMSRGKGLGLADMLVQQLAREGAGGGDLSSASQSESATAQSATATSGTAFGAIGIPKSPSSRSAQSAGGTSTTTTAADATTAGSNAATSNTTATSSTASTAGAASTGSATSTGSAAATAVSEANCPTSAQQAAFARALWPDAQQAARQLGVNPVTLLAQAALETNWGRSLPQDANGGSSNNLFGIKASAAWNGSAISSSTQEYSGGMATTVKAQFRSYGSTSQCFQDYVGLLKGNPRYAAALGTGNDVQAFGSALQQGGYATDPAYASKLTAVAGTLTRALTQRLASAVAPAAAAAAAAGSGASGSLKFAGSLPTTSGSGTL